MKFINNSKILVLCLACILLSGCATPYLILKKHKTLDLKEGEGVILMSAKFKNLRKLDAKKVFTIRNVVLQEINQYKAFKDKPLMQIPVKKDYYNKIDDLYTISFKLPEGTYRLAYLFGKIHAFWSGGEYYVNSNKLFEVKEGEINYIGRFNVTFKKKSIRGSAHSIDIENKEEEDIGRFKSNFVVFQGRSIGREFIF